ncbi:MAG: hypothetical protein Q8O89_04830 [Nanoarchaeota archaeon]|nr:hypothetical protein [Nanoarchaeota archaeon]
MNFDEEFKENQRVSELASHLMKTGTAASYLEAEKRAKEMIYGTMQPSSTAAKAASAEARPADEYTKLLEMSHNVLMKEVGAVKYKVDQLFSEMISIRTELSKMQIQAAAKPERTFAAPSAPASFQPEARAAPEPVQKEAAPVPAAAPVQPAAQPQAASKPTNPSDISIEKYFYFGNKK